MTQEEILEYNKRCAEFLGIKTILTNSNEILYSIESLPEITIPVGSSGINTTIQTGLLKANVKQLVFHSDWNWIHEVIKAIEKLGFNTSLTNKFFCIMKVENRVGTTLGSSGPNCASKQKAAVQAINQFLIWYNENKN